MSERWTAPLGTPTMERHPHPDPPEGPTMSGTVTLHYPSHGYRGGGSPCPDCGRDGGTPDLAHAGWTGSGDLDLSLAGLRCTAELLSRLLAPYAQSGAQDRLGDAEALASYLADAMARLDLMAGGLDR